MRHTLPYEIVASLADKGIRFAKSWCLNTSKRDYSQVMLVKIGQKTDRVMGRATVLDLSKTMDQWCELARKRNTP